MSEIRCNFQPPDTNGELLEFHRSSNARAQLASLVDSIAEHYDASEPESATADHEIATITSIAEAVGSCVRFQPDVMPWERKPEGDCFTFTWLIADSLDRCGFDSRIVFSNGHAFNMVLGENNRHHIINGETKAMWLFDDGTPSSVASTMFDYEHLEQQGLREMNDSHGLTVNFKTYDAKQHAIQASGGKLDLPYLGHTLPFATLMTPTYGRQALFTYHYFHEALVSGYFLEVAAAIDGLTAANPYPETRQRLNPDLKKFRTNVKFWAQLPGIENSDLLHTITQYGCAMPDTKGMRQFLGDCIRDVAQQRQDEQLVELAKSYYHAAYVSGKYDKTLQGKLKKAERIQAAIVAAAT
ncbi:TPA: hypothetical protein EYO12_01275 [Candidatus Saccharibacteria bacterium]|nr:hypothetical protein [Candidatus Saccharibacteria bacterium]HIO87350.1 hypothetical protein [Candidatus Saccharibacteria bacterium]